MTDDTKHGIMLVLSERERRREMVKKPTPEEKKRLRKRLKELLVVFKASGGRGVELADEIDELRARIAGEKWPPEDEY